MNNDLVAVLDYLVRDRGLDREVITRVIEEALEAAARKAVGPNELKVKLDPKTGDIAAVAKLTVATRVTDPGKQISLANARTQIKDAKVGDEIEWHVPTKDLGRIVAQTTRQGIFQRLRQVEKDLVRAEYKDRVGEILYGSVCRFDKGDVIVDFGGREGTLPHAERIPTEDYQVGDHLSCVLVAVNMDQPGPVLVVSRAHESLVQKLFEREVAEIAEGVVTIKAVSREPGFRSKIAVHSADPKVDPVGACVGIRGSRVKAIVRELSGEKVDIVPWDANLNAFVAKALQPAQVGSISIDEENKQLVAWVDPSQFSLAIGKRGQNARLAAKLLPGWKLDIRRIESPATAEPYVAGKIKEICAVLAQELGIPEAAASLLAANGFNSVDGVRAAEETDLAAIDGIGPELAALIKEAARSKSESA
jgi:N utilization substance protein A